MADWHELIIEGAEKVVRAFVAGVRAGRGETVEGVFAADVGIEPGSFGERLKALFTAGSHHAFLAPESLATLLASALTAVGAKVGLRLESRRAIGSAVFSFRIEVYSREVARDFRSAFVDPLPAGVRVAELSENEETHPDAVGAEPFAPLHDYIYRASGRIEGAFDPVLRLWLHAREREFSEIGSLTLTGKTL
jgi:hypothetical protein